MAHLRKARDRGDRLDVRASGSLGLLAIVTALLGVALSLILWLLPAALVLPTFGLVSLVAGGVASLLAWLSEAERGLDDVTLWDIGGALVLFGFAAGMLSDPTHAAQLFGLATAAR